MPESPRLSNRSLQSRTRGSRNRLLGGCLHFQSCAKVKVPAPISALPASTQVKVQTACSVAQRRDRCKVPGPEWSAQNATAQQDGRGGVGADFSGLSLSPPRGFQGGELDSAPPLDRGRLPRLFYSQFGFSGCFPRLCSLRFPVKTCPVGRAP